MKAKEYDVLVMAVEEGVAAGWRHAYKHSDVEPPNEDADPVKRHIVDDVLTAICEWFNFDPQESEE